MGQEKSFFWGGGESCNNGKVCFHPLLKQSVYVCLKPVFCPKRGRIGTGHPRTKGGMGLRPLPWAMQQLMGSSVGWGGVEYHRG